METINKLLIAAVSISLCISIIASAYVITNVVNSNVNKNITLPVTPPTPPHPYNECMKLFIDQSNKESTKCDFDKAKTVCFELLNKDK